MIVHRGRRRSERRRFRGFAPQPCAAVAPPPPAHRSESGAEVRDLPPSQLIRYSNSRAVAPGLRFAAAPAPFHGRTFLVPAAALSPVFAAPFAATAHSQSG